MDRHVLIVGGGASGLTAAIFAARAGVSVTILEHRERVGKKILSTGNGRCNFTNRDQKPEYYRSEQPDFPWQVVRRFPFEDTLAFFRSLGILPKEKNGYFYPNSDQAASVLDVLRFETERLGVRTVTNCHVTKIGVSEARTAGKQAEKTAQERRFAVETTAGRFSGDALILAAGSQAAFFTGSDGSGYELARQLDHRIIEPLPALVQLRCKEKDYKQLAGVRTEGTVELYVSSMPDKREDWRLAARDRGEIQLTDYGISGIPVFQVSRYASIALRKGWRVKAILDFLPQMTQDETKAFLMERREGAGDFTCDQFMTGILNRKLCQVLLKRAGIDARARAAGLSDAALERLLRQMKSFETIIAAANSFEYAQVCRGGADTRQVNPDTLESRLVRGLYFAGEILDVDGICGGYNLQWAWSSGAVAGKAAAEYARQAATGRDDGL